MKPPDPSQPSPGEQLQALLDRLPTDTRHHIEAALRRWGYVDDDDSIVLVTLIFGHLVACGEDGAKATEEAQRRTANLLREFADSQWGQIESMHKHTLEKSIGLVDHHIKRHEELAERFDHAGERIEKVLGGNTEARLKQEKEYGKQMAATTNLLKEYIQKARLLPKVIIPPRWWQRLLIQAAALSTAAVVFAATLAIFVHPTCKEVAASWISLFMTEKVNNGVSQPDRPKSSDGAKPPDSLEQFGGFVELDTLMLPNREGIRCLVVDVDHLGLGANGLGKLVIWPGDRPTPLGVQPFNLPGKPLPTP